MDSYSNLMKAPFHRVILDFAFVLGVLGLAYFSGQNHLLQPRVPVASGQNAKSSFVETAPPMRPGGLPPILPNNEARTDIMNYLAGNWPDVCKTKDMKRDAVMTSIEELDPKEFSKLVAEVNSLPDSKDKDLVMYAMIWYLSGATDSSLKVYANPVLALSLLDCIKDPSERQRFQRCAFGVLASSDPQQALVELAKLPPGTADPSDYGDIFGALAKQDPAKAEAMMADLPPGAARTSALQSICGNLALTDPHAAIQWIMSLPLQDSEQAGALKRVGLAWVHTDLQAALNWALTLPLVDSAVLNSVILSQAMKNPQFVAANFDKLSDDATRNAAIQSMAPIWAAGPKGDPTAAINWLNQVATGVTYEKAVNSIIAGLADPAVSTTTDANGQTHMVTGGQANYAAAVSVLAQVTDPTARSQAIVTLASNWTQDSPQDALTWAQSLQGSESVSALNAIVSTWSKSDPTAAFAYVQNSPDPTAFASIAPALAQAEAQANPQAALAFAQSLPDGDAKTQALNNALVGLAKSDFPDAWSDATNLPDGDTRTTEMTNLVGTEAAKDPTQAVPLLDQFAAGPVQNNATRTLAKAWAAQDPTAASTWMNTLPPGSQRNVAVVELITAQSAKDPATALQWAATITTPTTQANQVQKIITTWAKTDPAAALNAAQSSNLPDNQKAALVQTLTKAASNGK
jgi:hypothetical protein